MRILVTGASGLIGQRFIRHALKEGHEVYALVRNPDQFKLLPAENVFRWRSEAPIHPEVLGRAQAVVHLAGENIADRRWTAARKRALVDSRVRGTRQIVEALSALPKGQRPKVLLSGSAIGYYGYVRESQLDESASPGSDFLAQLCVEWEREALRAESLGLRVALARTGIVLSRSGGALAKMPPIRLSNGRNWMSWIHIDDMVRALLFILQNESIAGPVNCVAPHPVQNLDFTRALASQYRVPALGFVPRAILSLALGELSRALLSSAQVVPALLLRHGFGFQHPHLSSALESELRGIHLLDKIFLRSQFVPLSPKKVFPFFSRAENLETLTPPWLNFRIVAKSSEEICANTLIEYKLKIHGMPVRWRTRISDWKPNEYFIDEQLKGPYSKWHHLHTFERVPGGCLLHDEVTYRIPGSVLGSLLLGAWIGRDVSTIFSYRQRRIQELLDAGELK